MPEPFASGWLVLIGSGGYILAVVQFFKELLTVKKLRLEIDDLRRKAASTATIIHAPTPDEIERVTRPLTSRRSVGVSIMTGTLIIVASLAALGSTALFGQLRATSSQSGQLAARNEQLREELSRSEERTSELADRFAAAQRRVSEQERLLEEKEKEIVSLRSRVKPTGPGPRSSPSVGPKAKP
jgi:uncharacterized protein HemX